MKDKLPSERLDFRTVRWDNTCIIALLDYKVSIGRDVRSVTPDSLERGSLLGVPWRSVIIYNVFDVRVVVEVGHRMHNNEGIDMNVEGVLDVEWF